MAVVDASPYPWPYDGVLDPRRAALVVAGNQYGWARRCVDRVAVSARIEQVAAVLRGVGGVVVHLRHSPSRSGRSLLPPPSGQDDWRLFLDPREADLVVDAGGIDGFFGGPLDSLLRARSLDRLVLSGFGAEAPVDSTLRSANDRGYECLTLVDAVAPFQRSTGRGALASITMSGGIFGATATSAALCAAFPVLEVFR